MSYINETAFYKLNNVHKELILLNENIFSFKAWSDEHEKEIKDATQKIRAEKEKELNSIPEYLKKNFKKDYDFIKFHNLPLVKVLDNYSDFKELFLKIQKISSTFDGIHSADLYEYLRLAGPASIFIDLDEKYANKKFDKNDKDSLKYYKYFFINVPDKNLLNKLFSSGVFLGSFQKKSWVELEKELILYHEAVEISEFVQKRQKTGNYYIKSGGSFHQIGNHNSIIVLAKEAVVLNKYKNLEAIKTLRDYRKMFEWKIIKEKTGIDFSTLKTLDKTTYNKLIKIKLEKFGNETGFFTDDYKLNDIDLKDIKKSKVSNTINSKEMNSAKYKKIAKIVNIL